MSEPKLISPLLDNFAIGGAISAHNGVSCYPAMRQDADDKYIVKVISIPASSRQLDALLLTGAYPTAQAANSYFESLVSDVENEAQVLQHFSKLDGFLAYEGYQVVPKDDGIGFDVYLLGSYKRTLARFFKNSPMTHLGALNLGIDLCSAMSACRQAGCLYINLKPENIFITDDGHYCVGDLGFIPLSSLKYASLPDKYRSSYTAPEVVDAFSSLNTTMDVYAIGLILYQAYNNGTLPFAGSAPKEALQPPMYADYEMADIILKACAPDPDDRWQDTKLLGQALVSYMQRNGANDTPIVPPAVSAEENDSEEDTFISVETETEEAPVPEAAAQDDSIPEELAFISQLVSDETAPSEEDSEALEDAPISDDLSEILAQAEDLLAHETPGPVVAPEAIEIPMPEPIELGIDETVFDEVASDDGTEAEADETPEAAEEDVPVEKSRKMSKTGKRLIAWAIWLIILAGLAFGAYFFYNNYYMQNIDNLTVSGSVDHLTVNIDSDTPDEWLTVVCTDTYGGTQRKSVSGGVATFSDLKPGTQYSIHLEISGLHQLEGNTTASYATPTQTDVLSFNAIVGPEDGSVILSFTVSGKDSDNWSVIYTAEGEEEKTASFTGHTVAITGLAVGKEYNFRLAAGEDIYLVGTTELTFTDPKLILAENLTVTAVQGEILTLSWNAPANTAVEGWNIRCYNESGYEVTHFAKECTATLVGVDTSSANTIEVTAVGMTQCVRTFITANPITVTEFRNLSEDSSEMRIQWDFAGEAPAAGWLLFYNIDGYASEEVVPCDTNTVSIPLVVPGGSYHFTLQAANGATLFGGTFAASVPAAESFADYGIEANNMYFYFCRTPNIIDWKHTDLEDEDYTSEFKPGEKASLLVDLNVAYNVDYENTVTLLVIRDSAGGIVSLQTQERVWYDMWNAGYCEIDIPAMPETAGEYTIEVYFDGAYATTESFTIL